jgi:hypothetical protein
LQIYSLESKASKAGLARLSDMVSTLSKGKEDMQAENQALKDKCKWLIAEGLNLFAKRIHSDIVPTVLNVNRAANACGFNEGIRCGLFHASKGETDISSFKEYDKDAKQKLVDNLTSLKTLSFEMVEQLAQLDISDIEKIKEMLKPTSTVKPSSGK